MRLSFIASILLYFTFFLPLNAIENGDVTSTYKNKNGRKIEKLFWSDTKDKYVLVSYPKNFDIAKTYHLNFWFPGTTGKPSQGIEDENDQYIGIGLSYLNAPILSTESYTNTHWTLCRNVEKSVVDRLNLKVGKRLLSGVSKGGWLAFDISLNPPDGLHGIGIIAAGKYTRNHTNKEFKGSKLAIFIGTGETDSNYPHAQLAIPFYKKHGVESLCYEEWLREGHVSKISPRVNDWLNVQAKRSGNTKDLSLYCNTIVNKKLEDISTIKEDIEKYIALRHLMNSPHTSYASKEIKDHIINLNKELIKRDSIKIWLVDYNKIRNLVKVEATIFHRGNIDAPKLKPIVDQYQLIANNSQFPNIKARAAYAYLRMAKLYTIQKLLEISQKAPDYVKLQNQFDDLQAQLIGTSKLEAKESLIKLQQLANELNTYRNKLSMKAFYDVEWHNKFEIAPSMDSIIKRDKLNAKPKQAYSGIAY